MLLGSYIWDDVYCDAGRTCEFDWAAKAKDQKTAVNFAANDKVRFKLADSEGGDPFLDLVTGVPSELNSEVTIVTQDGSTPATGKVIISEGDDAELLGTKYGELILVDMSEPATRRNKPICRGVMIFRASKGGNVGA